MSDIIQLLPKHIINQIVTGRVIYRSASAVKELIENSLDANAKLIELILIKEGRSLICVKDDGKGMSITDAHRSFNRYSTSKVYNEEDLFKIQTMGFRGEALAAISAKARVEMCTRRESDKLGTYLLIEKNELKKESFVQSDTGTSISVKNIFYNTPDRRTFFKSPQVELRYILSEFYRLTLAHPKIHFRMCNNEKCLFDLSPVSLRQRITGIFGQKINEQLVPISEQVGKISLEGFVVRPSHSRRYRGEQFFFVNHRFIKSPYLHKAILDAFEGILSESHYLSYFIFLKLDPNHIDINIHSTKTEIKFNEKGTIYVILRSAVKRSLSQYQVTSTLDFDENMVWEPIPSKDKNLIRIPEITFKSGYNPFKDE